MALVPPVQPTTRAISYRLRRPAKTGHPKGPQLSMLSRRALAEIRGLGRIGLDVGSGLSESASTLFASAPAARTNCPVRAELPPRYRNRTFPHDNRTARGEFRGPRLLSHSTRPRRRR